MNAIDQMKDEHCQIKAMLQVLDNFCTRLESGTPALLDHGWAMLNFFQAYADKFHHEKEEQLVFPLLEKLGVPRNGGPVELMLEDHVQGRAYLREMAGLLERLREGDPEALRPFAQCARNYHCLMLEHIRTEDDAIFDMVEMRLSAAQLEQFAAEFATLEKLQLGTDKEEELLSLLCRLEQFYP